MESATRRRKAKKGVTAEVSGITRASREGVYTPMESDCRTMRTDCARGQSGSGMPRFS